MGAPERPVELPSDPGEQAELRDQIRRWLYRQFGPEIGPTDVAGEVHRTAMERKKAGRSTRGIWSWARRRAIDALRRLRTAAKVRATRPAPPDPPPPHAAAEAAELVDVVAGVLNALPHYQRAVWLMSHDEGLTYPEIARRLGKTPEAVKQVAWRVRKALADAVAAAGYGPGGGDGE